MIDTATLRPSLAHSGQDRVDYAPFGNLLPLAVEKDVNASAWAMHFVTNDVQTSNQLILGD